MFPKNKNSNIQQNDGQNNTQQFADTINNYYPASTPTEAVKSGILQHIIENLIELVVPSTIEDLDIYPYKIEEKIEYNHLTCYLEPFEFYMDNRLLIQYRLDHLINHSDPLAAEKLFKVIRLTYFKYCNLNDPNEIIRKMEDDLSKPLLTVDPSNFENIQYIPSIIFYVFSECKIFKKPKS